MAGEFEVYQKPDGEYTFHLKASNGVVVVNGPVFDTKAAARWGCEAVQKAADGASIVEVDA